MGRRAHALPHADTPVKVPGVTFTTNPALSTHAPWLPSLHITCVSTYQHKPRPPALECNRQVFRQVKSWWRLPRGTTSVRYWRPALGSPLTLGQCT